MESAIEILCEGPEDSDYPKFYGELEYSDALRDVRVLENNKDPQAWFGERPLQDGFGYLMHGTLDGSPVYKTESGITLKGYRGESVDSDRREDINWNIGVIENPGFFTVAVSKDFDDEVVIRDTRTSEYSNAAMNQKQDDMNIVHLTDEGVEGPGGGPGAVHSVN